MDSVKPRYIDAVCRPFCGFFKEGEKEGEACGGVLFLDGKFSPDRCVKLGERVPAVQTADRTQDLILKIKLCDPCPFAAEDCDFRAGKDSPPCGGYVLLARALSIGSIGEEDL